MEYQKITNLLDNTPSQPTKFRTKACVDINITQKDNAKYIDAIMSMYNLIEYSDNY